MEVLVQNRNLMNLECVVYCYLQRACFWIYNKNAPPILEKKIQIKWIEFARNR